MCSALSYNLIDILSIKRTGPTGPVSFDNACELFADAELDALHLANDDVLAEL